MSGEILLAGKPVRLRKMRENLRKKQQWFLLMPAQILPALISAMTFRSCLSSRTYELALCTFPFLSVFYCRKCMLKKCSVLPKVSLVALVSELDGCEPGARWR